MLKFEEVERPSFIELAKLVLTSTENTLESPKGTKMVNGKNVVVTGNKMLANNASQSKSIELHKKESKTFSMRNFKENDGANGQSTNNAGSMEKGHVG